MVDEKKDSFDRQDIYDGQGVALWVYLNLKQQITQIAGGEALSLILPDSSKFLAYHRFGFLLEACMPCFNFLIQKSISHPNSESLRQIGIEMLAYFLLRTENEGSHAYESIGHFTKDND